MNQNNVLPSGTFFSLEGTGSLLHVFLKLLLVAGFFLYMVFAFMVIRQTTLMENTYRTGLGPLLKLFAIAHFLVTVGVFALALFAL